jgi:dCMP deaminase
VNQSEWDDYFLDIANVVAENSKCFSRKIGAVLVRDKAIISTGYNGPPRGMDPCTYISDATGVISEMCPRKAGGYPSGEGLHLCPAAHAERNALIQAARTGVSTMGSTLYCYCGQVCKDCAAEIVNAGCSRLVYLDGAVPYDNLAEKILKASGIEITIVKGHPLEHRRGILYPKESA